MSRWIKLYYRDEDKVMRALDGVKYALGPEIIWAERSVYTFTSDDTWYWLQHKE